MKTGADILEATANTFRERNAVYGDNWRMVGKIMAVLFPDGAAGSEDRKNEEDWNRLHIFILIVVKLTRYAVNWEKGGHPDSIHDMTVYCAMLEAIDEEIRHKSRNHHPESDADFRSRLENRIRQVSQLSPRAQTAIGKELDLIGDAIGEARR